MVKEFACRNCKFITIGRICGNCKSTDLAPIWHGIILVIDPINSKIAEMLKITKKGKYAIKVT